MASGVLIAGPVGVGKTSVAIAAGDILQERGAAAALIDLDWLGWLIGSELPISQVIATNLRAVWPNLRDAGAEYLILTRGIETEMDLRLFREAIPDVALSVATLAVSNDAIEKRLRRRDSGAQLEEHLLQFVEMQAAAEAHPGDLVISNEGRSVEETAAEILHSLGWL
ncbi:MAG: hypothetical protein ABR579_10645 [Actinomycetota bacterium]